MSTVNRGSEEPCTEAETSPVSVDSIMGKLPADCFVPLDPRGREIMLVLSRRFGEVVWLFQAPPLVRKSARINFEAFVESDDEVVVFSQAKVFFQHFSARLLGTPGPSVRLTGAFKRWVKSRSRGRVTREKIAFTESIMNLCKAMPYHTPRMEHNAVYKHYESISATVPLPPGPHDDAILEVLQPILRKIAKAIRSHGEAPYLKSSSTRGSFEKSRAKGGKLGQILSDHLGDRGKSEKQLREQYKEIYPLPLYVASPSPKGSKPWCPVPSEAVPVGELPVTRGRVEVGPSGDLETRVDVSFPLTEAMLTGKVHQHALEALETGRSRKLKVSLVCEAGKTRTVASGEANCCMVAQSYQQAVYDVLREEATFASLGRPFCATDISRCVDAGRAFVGPDLYLQSSDFKAASDNIRTSLTDRILGAIGEGHPYQSVVLDDNGDKEMHWQVVPRRYPRAGGRGKFISFTDYKLRVVEKLRDFERLSRQGLTVLVSVEGVKYVVEGIKLRATKRDGQLLGQATSFFLLNLVNYGCSLLAASRRKGAEDRLLINGDDRFFAGSEREEKRFWEIANTVGLYQSAGKSHTSKRFAVINAQRYVEYCGTWQRVDVLPVNLYFGVMKLSTDTFSPAKTLGTLVNRAPSAVIDRLPRGYLRKWAPQLYQELRGRSLWLPVALGGYGHSRPLWWRDVLTPDQVNLASRLYAAQSHCSFAFGPQWPGPSDGGRFIPPSLFHPSVNPFDLADSDIEFERIRKLSSKRRTVPDIVDELCVLKDGLCGPPGSKVRRGGGSLVLPGCCPESRICRKPPARCRYCSTPVIGPQECDLGGECVAASASDPIGERRYCDCHGYMTFFERRREVPLDPSVLVAASRPTQLYSLDHAHRSRRIGKNRESPYLDFMAPQYWRSVAAEIPLPPCAAGEGR